MNQIDYENLGSRMKELRIKMKLTQAEVAKALNVTRWLHQQRGE